MGRDSLMGTLLAAGGALSYGVTIVFNRSLAEAGLGPATTLTIRFAVGATVLLALQATRGDAIAPPRGQRLPCLLLGLLYTAQSTLFFLGLERGTAAAVTLLFYAYPVVVTVVELGTKTAPLTSRLVGALGLSVAGSAVVVVAGADVSISGAGVAFALTAAATFAIYLLLGDRVLRRSDAPVTSAWVALGCCLGHIVRGAAVAGFRSPAGQWPALVGNGVATAAAFFLMFAGLRFLGPARTAVVMTLEAVFGIALAALFLGETIGALQLVGGAAVLIGAAVVATTRQVDVLPAPADPP